MTNEILLTVVSAAYNVIEHVGEDRLRACIASVAALPFAHEHLIYDGASTDGTLKVLLELAQSTPGLIVSSARDSGIYEALNKGLHNAKGEYIYIIGLDDEVVRPDIFAEHLNTAIRTDVDMHIAPVILGRKHDLLPRSVWECVNEARVFSYGHQGVFIKTALIKSNAALLFDETYRISADYKQLLSLHWAGARVSWSADPCVLFSQEGTSARQTISVQECLRLQREIYGLSDKEAERNTRNGKLPLRIAIRFLRGGWFSKLMGLRVLLSYFWRKHKTETHSIYLLCGICVFRHLKKSMRVG